jgi:hypothetical protein
MKLPHDMLSFSSYSNLRGRGMNQCCQGGGETEEEKKKKDCG